MNSAEIRRMIQVVTARKGSIVKGEVYQCPVCNHSYYAADSKQIFCTNTGPGNCKNKYHTVVRSRAGAKIKDELGRQTDHPFELSPAELDLIAKVRRFPGSDRQVYVHFSAGEVDAVVVRDPCDFGAEWFGFTLAIPMKADRVGEYTKFLEDQING